MGVEDLNLVWLKVHVLHEGSYLTTVCLCTDFVRVGISLYLCKTS